MQPADERRMLDRLTAITDGVFAIAMTLLVLDVLKVPDDLAIGSADLDRHLFEFLWQPRAPVISFLLSFIVIAGFWMAHRRIMAPIKRDDGILGWIDLAFLLLIAYLPFPSAILGTYPDVKSAVVYYDASIIVTGLVLWLLAAYAHVRESVVDTVWGWQDFTKESARILLVPVIFATSLVLSNWSLDLARLVWALVIVAYPLAGQLFASRTHR